MGYYIERTDALPKGKADHFIAEHGAEELSSPQFFDKESGKVAVCVVDNGPFEAAAVAYNEGEFGVFQEDGSRRPRRWLSMDREKVKLLGPPGYAKLLDTPA